MSDSIKDVTNYLFNVDFYDEGFDPEGEEIYLKKSQELKDNYPWKDIISEWHSYLFNNCITPKSVINYANLFFYYGGADMFNPEPYRFIGYLYAHVDMDEFWEEAGDLFDSIAIDVLQNQMLIDLKDDPFYSPLKDPKILSEISNWKNN